MTAADMKFSASHLKDAVFKDGGLRSFFVYRDLGINEATKGHVMAHVLRAKTPHDGSGGWHRHSLDFQMYYVIKGWIKFRYEGAGEVLAEAGSCVHQPPGSSISSSAIRTISNSSRSRSRRSSTPPSARCRNDAAARYCTNIWGRPRRRAALKSGRLGEPEIPRHRR